MPWGKGTPLPDFMGLTSSPGDPSSWPQGSVCEGQVDSADTFHQLTNRRRGHKAILQVVQGQVPVGKGA